MTLTQDQEQIVELLRGLASAVSADPSQGQITVVIHPGLSDAALPWINNGVSGSNRDFGVGMPPLTQRYS